MSIMIACEVLLFVLIVLALFNKKWKADQRFMLVVYCLFPLFVFLLVFISLMLKRPA